MKKVFILIFFLFLQCGSECNIQGEPLYNSTWICMDNTGAEFSITFKVDGTGSSVIYGNFEWAYSECRVSITGNKVDTLEVIHLSDTELSFIFSRNSDRILATCKEAM